VELMNYADPELRDRLAAEYVLGTLSGLARRRFERLLSGDGDLRNLVEGWELRLSDLAESVPTVEPPEHVWEKIDRQLEQAPATAPMRKSAAVFWDSLGFWRGATALAVATAAVLLVYVTSLARRIEVLASRPTHVAVLIDKDQRPMMNADFNSADGRLVLRLNFTPHRDFNVNVLEVWVVAQDGTPHSLGIFPSERPGTTEALVLPRDTADDLVKNTLAVSLEPIGGSTTGQPSGPVLFTGQLMPSL
jgi:anti-sigma-K factor RskA